jgi:hypothetical protein
VGSSLGTLLLTELPKGEKQINIKTCKNILRNIHQLSDIYAKDLAKILLYQ